MQDAKTLLQNIRAIDLAILDSGLYLNAYHSDEAFSYFQALCDERASLAEIYIKNFAPLVKCDACHESKWIDTPWPWELEAN